MRRCCPGLGITCEPIPTTSLRLGVISSIPLGSMNCGSVGCGWVEDNPAQTPVSILPDQRGCKGSLPILWTQAIRRQLLQAFQHWENRRNTSHARTTTTKYTTTFCGT